MLNSKLNTLLLPLLIAVLLSVGGKLKIGIFIDNIFYTLLLPIHYPVGKLHYLTNSQVAFVKSLPGIRNQNTLLLSENSRLLSENEQLKQSISDTKTVLQSANFKSILPVRLTGSIGNNSVSSSLPVDKVKIGQPLVYGKIILGVVSDIKGTVINVTPLDNERIETIAVHTASGQKGQYKFQNNTPQITDIPSLSPVVLSDTVFTEPSAQIPGNLVVGKVVKLISAQQEPLQKAQIKLETSLREVQDGLAIVIEP